MSAKAVSELSGKELLYRHLSDLQYVNKPFAIRIRENDCFDSIIENFEWVKSAQVSFALFLKFSLHHRFLISAKIWRKKRKFVMNSKILVFICKKFFDLIN